MWSLFRRKREGVRCDGRLSHIAFIMDGNGRWARQHGLPREAGHAEGARNMRRIVEACFRRGIPTVTVYAFSSENWRRPESEVAAIMKLLTSYVETACEEWEKNRTHMRFLGDLSVLSDEMQERIAYLEKITAVYENTLNIALNYGGRQEIVHAVNSLLATGKTEVTEEDITSALYTAPSPMPDLVVRTGGELRISNFLLWQSAYAEYAFTKTYWPALREPELDRILSEFYARNRRYGGL